MAAQQSTSPEWAERIQRLLRELKVTQAGLAERLGISPATVSRWTQGKREPTAEMYVALGNLARRPAGVYFWERAGVDISGHPDASFRQMLSSMRVSLQDFKLVSSRKVSRQLSGKAGAVAIPLLNVTAYGDRVAPKQNVHLSEAQVEDVLLAPLAWCPHPENMISMHVSGDSMYPTIPSGSIIFVDTAATDRKNLARKLTVVAHRDLGFKIARFLRLAGADLLVSANPETMPIDISSASRWKIFGEVLWWVSKDAEPGH
ncbi:LexA family transcriptional regulator [Paracidobacterium acidisoli]|uniref:Helix-turn-helix domain-containing protein n=1 Tax=Paracidobacterium acidisoli TaxID=2303751 RepID=A0A372INE0_9BACT|nr:XRE family transcriptional regulator [Paracidobacterium acidisoli]MBT9332074.1 XRE family transcriptional regulator [Paracidobacterium acidisoli]